MTAAAPRCPECSSFALERTAAIVNTTGVVDGRLRIHDLKVVFVLGCEQCSHTCKTVDANSVDGHHILNPPKGKPGMVVREHIDALPTCYKAPAIVGRSDPMTSEEVDRLVEDAARQLAANGDEDLRRYLDAVDKGCMHPAWEDTEMLARARAKIHAVREQTVKPPSPGS